ncbi:uncharacterized protein [Atheta coriaria]|uniref:uncharacterized protein n=1 Tax=Dalotia coriaria TaxID=877792 RepID=UPI0031F40EDE
MSIVHTVISALLITLISRRVVCGHNCGHEQLVQCARPLSFITESGLTFVASRTDLEKICPDLKDALKCIHSYTRMCMNMHHRKHFKQLFHGTGATVHELCDNSTYQEEYLKYVPCMMQVADENQVCFDRYATAMKEIQNNPPQPQPEEEQPEIQEHQQGRHQNRDSVTIADALRAYHRRRKRETADEGVKNVCCTFQEYVQCSTHTTRRACGPDAAEFSRNFLDRMSSSMIKMHCSEYGASECGLSSTSPPPRITTLPFFAAAVLTALRCFTITFT